jgi:hypothetical protein
LSIRTVELNTEVEALSLNDVKRGTRAHVLGERSQREFEKRKIKPYILWVNKREEHGLAPFPAPQG